MFQNPYEKERINFVMILCILVDLLLCIFVSLFTLSSPDSLGRRIDIMKSLSFFSPRLKTFFVREIKVLRNLFLEEETL